MHDSLKHTRMKTHRVVNTQINDKRLKKFKKKNLDDSLRHIRTETHGVVDMKIRRWDPRIPTHTHTLLYHYRSRDLCSEIKKKGMLRQRKKIVGGNPISPHTRTRICSITDPMT